MIPAFPVSTTAPVRTVGQAPAGPGAAAALIEVALAAASGEALAPVSLTLDYAAPLQAGEAVTLEAAVERMEEILARMEALQK